MDPHIVITLPRWDDVTEYLSAYSKEIIDTCKQNQISITLLEKARATKEGFCSSIRKNTKMFVFNGHGAPDCICGHKDEKIISLGINDSLLKNKITYARSCWSFSKLGQVCIDKEKECFIGYILPFQFVVEKKWISNPLKDKTAKVFFDSSNLITIGLIKGKTAGESNKNSKRSMLKTMNKILGRNEQSDKAILEALWNNYDSQKIIGNKDIKLY